MYSSRHISPGYMDTGLTKVTELEEARRVWVQRNPTGRMGNPEEVTGPGSMAM